MQLRFLLGIVSLWLIGSTALAENVGVNGLYVAVPSPVTSAVKERVENRIKAAMNQANRPSRIIFDFNPTDQDAAGSDFGPSSDLAYVIKGIVGAETLAFVHGKVTGHTVLPVMACQNLVMSQGALIGEIVAFDAPLLPEHQISGYVSLLTPVRPNHLAIVKRMYDKNTRLVKGQKAGGIWFADLRERAALEKQGVLIPNETPAFPDGRSGLFSTQELLDFGLCKVSASNRQEVAEQYDIAMSSLRDDPLSGKSPVAFRYVLKGPVNQSMADSVDRIARNVISQKGNILFLHIECGGGDMKAATDLAEKLYKLQHPDNGDDGLMIVAFVPNEAPDTAAVVALGCSDIVMSKRTDAGSSDGESKEAVFGNFEILATKYNVDPKQYASTLKQLAAKQNYPGILIDGMLDKNLTIVQAQNRKDRTKTRLMTRQELITQDAEWKEVSLIKAAGVYLKLTATQAQRLNIARSTIDSTEPKEMYTRYGVDPAKITDATPAWLDRLANFLRDRAVTVILVVIGFTGLILELKVPGAVVPGVIAALCFVMVFWAHTGFSGQVVALAGLLFLLGLILVLLEVFVFPGFGAAGIFGVMLILGSLALVTVEELPRTGTQWMGFGARLGQYLFGLIGAVGLSFFLTRYLRRIPFLNKMTLPTAEEIEASEQLNMLPGAAQAARLLGAIGTSATVLRPAGTVRFGEEFVDVVTEGGYIAAGSRVQVVEVEGTRIVVKEV